MAYDTASNQLLLVRADVGDTNLSSWAWNGTTWSKLSPVTSPPNGAFDLAYDPGTSTVVAVVAVDPPPNPDFPTMWPFCKPTQTWTWNGKTWTKAFSESVSYTAPRDAPAGTGSAVMAYDPVSNSLVHYGGWCETEIGAVVVADTWTWNGSVWTHKSDDGGPTGDTTATYANDPISGHVVVFGGCADKYCEMVNNETWTWTGAGWLQLHPHVQPPARGLAAMALDPASGRVVLFGGSDGMTNLSDTWAWDGSDWSRAYASDSPSARAGASMAFDGGTGHLLLRGGFDAKSTNLSDSWNYFPYGVPGKTPVGTVTEFTAGIVAGGQPWDIARGTDGAMWFTELYGNRIGRITTSGTVKEYSQGITKTFGSGPWSITAGADGALWFTEDVERLARITTGGVVSEFSSGIASDAGGLWGITSGPDRAIWFTEAAGRIGRISGSGVVTEFSTGITPGTGLNSIAAGPDGALWFTEQWGNRIGRITVDGHVTEYDIGTPDPAGPWAIAAGPDGTLWFTANSANLIGRISPIGQISTYGNGLTAGSQPFRIAAGPDGNLWFTEQSGGRIGRISTTGVITEFSTGITASPGLGGIAAGPDGAMWFTEASGNRIGRITTGLPSSPLNVTASVGGHAITVRWQPPSDAGATGLTGYRVTAVPGGRTCSNISEYCTFTGLTPGITYRFAVEAINATGRGPASALSTAVMQLGAPLAPRSVVGSPRNRAALVTWAAPVSNGGSTITRYTVTATPGGRRCVTTGARSCTVTGLTNRRAYRFTVKATTRLGVSASSAASAAIVVGTPSAPRIAAVTFPARGSARATWKPSAYVGSGAVVAYQVRWSSTNGRTWSAWASTRLSRVATRTGLSKGHAYVVQVRALNGSGLGPPATRAFLAGR